MDKRIFVEKKSNFNIKAQALVKELKHNLQLTSLTDLRIIQVYDVFGQFSAWKLRNMTHEESPWKNHEDSAEEIPFEEMQEYFKTRIE